MQRQNLLFSIILTFIFFLGNNAFPLEERAAPDISLKNLPVIAGISLGDLNDDHLPDLVLCLRKPKIYLFYQKNGTYPATADKTLALPRAEIAQGALVGDFDSDNKADLAAASKKNLLYLFLGKDGFTKCIDVYNSNNQRNDDGISMLNRSKQRKETGFLNGPVWRIWNSGKQRWIRGYCFGPEKNDNAVSTVADMDFDNEPDIVFLSRSGAVRIYYGPFTSRKVEVAHLSAFIEFAPPAPASCLDIADFNHDGRPDIVVSSKSGKKMFFYFQSAPVGFEDLKEPSITLNGVSGILRSADINGDKRADLIVARRGKKKKKPQILVFYQRKKDKKFPESGKEADRVLDFPGWKNISDVYLSDIDRDGMVDIVAAGRRKDQGSEVRIFLNSTFRGSKMQRKN